MTKRRRAIVIILILLTLILGALSIFITVQIQQSQAPGVTGASAASDGCNCSLNGCGNGCWQWNCNSNCNTGANNFRVYLWTCPNSLANNAACGGCGQSNGGSNINSSTARSGTFQVNQCGASQVDIGYDLAPGGIITGACFSFANSCGGGPPPPGPPPPPPPPPPPQASCQGGTCTTDSSCKAPANGGVAVCRNGKCENRDCPAGKTIPGANCDCGVAGRVCGQTCGASVGLCGDGKSTCAFMGRSCSGNEYSNPPTTCIPNSVWAKNPSTGQPNVPGWTAGYQQCGGNTWFQYQGRTPTSAEIQAACDAQNVRTTCYRCTAANTDGNTC